MKTIALLAALAFALPVAAQTTTNIAYRVTVETVVGGVTNSVNTNFRFDYGTKKEALRVDGLALGFGQAVANGSTETFGQWLKQDIIDRAKAYQDAKQAADNAVLLAKIQSLLIQNPDLLSASDLTSLNTIAAKAP